jgi:hypothetical protein
MIAAAGLSSAANRDAKRLMRDTPLHPLRIDGDARKLHHQTPSTRLRVHFEASGAAGMARGFGGGQ